MAVKKNPDWHVWLGDILYWIRRPPGIYIVTIAILSAGLWYSVSKPSPPKLVAYTAPQIAPPPVRTCDFPGGVWVNELNGCLPRLTQPSVQQTPPGNCQPTKSYDPRTQKCLDSAQGSPNSCPFNYTFVARLDACIALDSNANWTLAHDDQFTLSGVPAATIKVIGGDISVTNLPAGAERFFTTGETVYLPSGATVKAYAAPTRLYIRFE